MPVYTLSAKRAPLVYSPTDATPYLYISMFVLLHFKTKEILEGMCPICLDKGTLTVPPHGRIPVVKWLL